MTIITDITTSRNKAYIINSDRYIDDVPPPARGRERLGKEPSGLLQRTACSSRNVREAGVIGISVGIYYLMYFLMISRAMLANMNPAAAPINAPAIISPR